MIKYSDKIKCNIILPIHLFFLIDDSYGGEQTIYPLCIKIPNSRLWQLWLVNTFSVFLCPGVLTYYSVIFSLSCYKNLSLSCWFADTRYPQHTVPVHRAPFRPILLYQPLSYILPMIHLLPAELNLLHSMGTACMYLRQTPTPSSLKLVYPCFCARHTYAHRSPVSTQKWQPEQINKLLSPCSYPSW